MTKLSEYHQAVDRAAEVMRCFAPFVVAYSNHEQAHSGPGFYVWSEEYADEGSDFVGNDPDVVRLAEVIVRHEIAQEPLHTFECWKHLEDPGATCICRDWSRQ